MILLFSRPEDEHGTAVAAALGELGHAHRRLEARDLWTDHVYSIRPDSGDLQAGNIFSTFRKTGGAPEAMAATAIWWRRPARIEDSLAFQFPTGAEIAMAEAWHALRLAAEAMPASLFPLGHPSAIDKSANKLRQLALARDVGFHVPATIVGNDTTALGEFLSARERVVVKPLHAAAAYEAPERKTTSSLLWCRGLASADLLGKLPAAGATQLMVQQAVDKRADWRITVLPHTTIACEIDTSTLGPDEPDWRKKTMELPHRIFTPDDAFDRLLRRYVTALDLPAGYFDFAIDDGGTPWFLEMNTNAQWLWIERLTGHPIAREVAIALAGAGKSE
jgi:glutathione synthase/RimK-type ligase-like ATP-grasp enzyme